MANLLGINPKDFKHVKSDDKSTTLRHKNGHVLTIAHNVLNPEMKAQLKALSNVAKEAQTPVQAQEKQDQQPKMATGGMPLPLADTYAKGGEAHKKEDIDKKMEKSQEYAHGTRDVSHLADKHDTRDKVKMAEGGDTEQQSMMDKVRQIFAPPTKVTDPLDVEHEKTSVDDFKPIPHTIFRAPIQQAEGTTNVQQEPEPSSSPSVLQKIQEYLSPERAEPLGTSWWDKEHQKGVEDFPAATHAKGGEVAHYDQGTDNVQQSDAQPEVSPGVALGRKIRELITNNPKVQLADALLHKEAKVMKEIPGFIQGVTGNEPEAPAPQPRQPAQQAPAPQPETMPVPTPEQTQEQNQAEPQQPDPVQISMMQGQNALNKAYQEQMAGFAQEAKAKQQMAQDKAAPLQASIDAQQAVKDKFTNHLQDLDNERQAIFSDLWNRHIDPEQYWTGDAEGNGSHSKILTGLGIILAGFNPTNNPNAAINFLKYQMDKNLDSQAKNIDKQQNLLRNNLDQYHNVRDAMDATRLQQEAILSAQMLQAANKASSPLAKAEMLQKQGQLTQSFIPLRQQFALRQTLADLANGGTRGNNPSDTRGYEHALNYIRMMDPEQAKQMQERLVPGVGVGSVPIPENVRTEIVAHKKLDDATNDLLNWTRSHTTINPMSADYRTGQQKALVLQQMIREGMLGTVFRESEKPLLEKFVNENPANVFKMINTDPKLQQILKSSEAQLNALKQTYGLPTKITHAPQAQPQIKTVNGVRYMRGPNGEAIPVK